MNVRTRGVVGLVLVCTAFFLVLTCLDFLLMNNFQFWINPDVLYRYWIILGLVVVVFSFALSFMSYVNGQARRVWVATFLTPLLLFAGGLLDLFYCGFSFMQGRVYSWSIWSFQWKIFSYWDGALQAIWSTVFFAVVGLLWYLALRDS